MSAYVIADVQITDPVPYEEYRSQVLPTLTKHGGRFIVRGGAAEPLDGDWKPGRLVVIEFPSMDALKGWYNSPEYARLKKIRWSASNGSLIAVQGV